MKFDNSKNIKEEYVIENTNSNIIYYNPNKRNLGDTKKTCSKNHQDMSVLNEFIKYGFEKIIDKTNCGKYSNQLFRCFELGCFILYSRDISDEVLQKQKAYGDEYLVDFIKYILRMFFRRYDENYILEKDQCIDIKLLCRELINIRETQSDSEIHFINRLSGKEIAEQMKNTLGQIV